jgi:signal transduction histidine kinase
MRLPRADFPALTIALWAMMLLLAAYTVGLFIPKDQPSFLVDTVGLATGLAAIAVFVVVAIHTHFRRVEVVLVGLAVCCNVFADFYYTVAADSDGYLKSPSVSDLGYFLFYPLLFAAFAIVVLRNGRPRLWMGWTVALDAAVAILGAGALLVLLLGPVLSNLPTENVADALIAASYPVLDLLLVAVVGAVAASPHINLGHRSTLGVIGMLAFAAGDVLYTLLGQQGLYQSGTPIDVLWPIGLVLFAWWAAGQGEKPEPSRTPIATSVPILTATVLTALAVLVTSSQLHIHPLAVVLAALTLGLATVPVILRQVQAKRLLAAQQEIVTQLEEVDRSKSEMLATVNHEIRTPLTSIRGYLELVINGEAGPIPAEAERMLRTVDHNADRLALLVDDMLTMSRLDSGTAIPERERVDLLRLLYRVVASLQPLASSREVNLDIDEFDVEAIVIGDEVQLERAFTNITQNAVKFTPSHGSVGIELERDGDEIVVRIIDTGIGIPESDMHLLFGRFFRASNAQREAVPGTGLGLAIVRGLVRAHQGDITIASTVDVGTTVRVTLPVAP